MVATEYGQTASVAQPIFRPRPGDGTAYFDRLGDRFGSIRGDDSEHSESLAEDGWTEEETSWTDSYVANPVSKFVHEDGATLCLWCGAIEEAAAYSVSDDDEFAVELHNGDGELVDGEAFEAKEPAEAYLQQQRRRYPDN